VASPDGDVLCIQSVDQPYLTRKGLSELMRETPATAPAPVDTDSGTVAEETQANPLESPSTSPPLVGRSR
jgi:hypothetical protein